MMGERLTDQGALFYEFSLDRHVPSDHLLRAIDRFVILAGDFNVVPTDADIYSTRSWLKNALLQQESRAAYERLLAQGWTDAMAEIHPNEPVWTFWSYFRESWARNAGLRIDHLSLTPDLAEALTGAGVDREVRGRENASDHAPVWIELSKSPS